MKIIKYLLSAVLLVCGLCVLFCPLISTTSFRHVESALEAESPQATREKRECLKNTVFSVLIEEVGRGLVECDGNTLIVHYDMSFWDFLKNRHRNIDERIEFALGTTVRERER